MDPKAYRLPRSVLPRHYEIALDARVGRAEFWGRVVIDLEIAAAGAVIELHARDLQLTEARLTTAGRAPAQGMVTLDPVREIARIDFGQPLSVGDATLEIAFCGQVSNGLEGLYLAENGPEQLLCTQCEATTARLIFPCFDEPTFKARFTWQITTAPDATVLANGALVGATASADGTAKTWRFAPTKPMSTYLAALVIGQIAGTPETVVAGTPLRIWAPTGKEALGAFAHAYTARLLPWFEDYFGVPYHWQKLDQVAVPGFSAGAMENVGLVLYRQSVLIMDPQTTSWQQEKVIAGVVAHEFAHMWFGNLVTMEWWDDLWLNEAFATWLAYHVVHILSPEYKVWDDFQGGKAAALAADAFANTHPIYNRVETPADAREMFDAITYQKGCTVLRMLHDFLGDAPFRAGLHHYLTEYAESNATGHDLWRALQDASQEPVVQIMDTWVRLPGYPLVRVSLAEAGEKATLHLSQQRFFADPAAPADPDAIWPLPLIIRYEDSAGVHETRALLKERSLALPLAVQGTLAWCHANAAEVGYYRQAPAPPLLGRLLAHLDRLAPVEQVGLLGDQWALVGNGSQPITPFLDVLATAARSEPHQVLAEVVKHLHTLENLLEDVGDAPARAGFRAWVGGLFRDRAAALGFAPVAGEAQNQAQTRMAVVDALTQLAADPAALDQARAWAAREAADPAAVDPNLATLFIAAAAQGGDAALFDRYVVIYQQRRAAGAAPQATDRYLYSFAFFRDPVLTARTFALLDTGVVPLEGFAPLLGQMFARPRTRLAAWEYLKAHWSVLEARAQGWIPIAVAISGQLPAAQRADVVAFFDAHLHGEVQQSYARALEQIDQWAAFQARTQDDLIAWFRAQAPAGG